MKLSADQKTAIRNAIHTGLVGNGEAMDRETLHEIVAEAAYGSSSHLLDMEDEEEESLIVDYTNEIANRLLQAVAKALAD